MHEFGLLNTSILVGYIVLTLVLGALISRKISSASQFTLGDKSIPWWAIGISVVSTYVSAMSFLGGPAWSYKIGLSALAIHLNYPLVIFFVVTVFMPFFYNTGLTSIYEYQERRFGQASRVLLSVIFLIKQVISSAAVLYATALVLAFITHVDVVYCIIIVTVVALVYTVMGGIAAVIWTDVIQAVILFIGAFIIMKAVWGDMHAPMVEVLQDLKSQGLTNALKTSWDLSQVATLWTGVIAMSMFHTTVYGGNQMMVQRCLTAKSMGDAKKSMLMMGYAAIFIYFLFFGLGILFHAYYGGKPFDNGNTIILTYASQYGMPGLMGIITAAILAASMSSLDSAFNSMATISVEDFYKPFFRAQASQSHYLKALRIATIIWSLVIIVPAFMYIKQDDISILSALSKASSYFVGATFCMFVLGFYSKRIHQKGLMTGAIVSFIGLWWVATYTQIAWPWYCIIGALMNGAVAWVVSLCIPCDQGDKLRYTVKGQQDECRRLGKPTTENGWHLLPGKIDAPCYGLLILFVVSLTFLYLFNVLIDDATAIIPFGMACLYTAGGLIAFAILAMTPLPFNGKSYLVGGGISLCVMIAMAVFINASGSAFFVSGGVISLMLVWAITIMLEKEPSPIGRQV